MTYLATLVPNLADPLKYAVVSGAVVGGGLTVIANAPNPAGQTLLAPYFDDAISPIWLFAGALVPTLVALGDVHALTKNLSHEGMKGMKRLKEKHSLFFDGRRQAEALKESALDLHASVFNAFSLVFDRRKKRERFSSALFKPFILHVRFLDTKKKAAAGVPRRPCVSLTRPRTGCVRRAGTASASGGRRG